MPSEEWVTFGDVIERVIKSAFAWNRHWENDTLDTRGGKMACGRLSTAVDDYRKVMERTGSPIETGGET